MRRESDPTVALGLVLIYLAILAIAAIAITVIL